MIISLNLSDARFSEPEKYICNIFLGTVVPVDDSIKYDSYSDVAVVSKTASSVHRCFRQIFAVPYIQANIKDTKFSGFNKV